MSGQGDFDEDEAARRTHAPQYNAHHPVPTVQKFRENRSELQDHQKQEERAERTEHEDEDGGKVKRAVRSVKQIFTGKEIEHLAGDPYPSENRNEKEPEFQEQHGDSAQPPAPPAKDEKGDIKNGATSSPPAAHSEPPHTKQETSNNNRQRNGDASSSASQDGKRKQQNSDGGTQKNSKSNLSATEAAARSSDPRAKRKHMKNMKRDDGGREVTDPVTHLPVTIYDSTETSLKKAPENEPASGSQPRTYTGLKGAEKSETEIDRETREQEAEHQGMQRVFPPPSFESTEAELVKVYQFALTVGLASIVSLSVLVLVTSHLLGLLGKDDSGPQQASSSGNWARVFIPVLMMVLLSSTVGFVIIWGIRGWLGKKVEEIWQDEVWDAARDNEQEEVNDASTPESTQWLNSLLASVWPLINPDLFASLVDTLEDVMQASLPKMVRMISVDDLGQGSEAFRVLGVKWLPTGAASQSVDVEGNLKSPKSQEKSDRAAPGEGQIEDDEQKDKDETKASEEEDGKSKDKKEQQQKDQEEEQVAEGLEAEQGDFVNLELALAYRARSSGRSLKTKAKNAHLYLKFYLPGGIALPVWVEVRGLILTMRLRLQLTPDPPFFALATITFLGQPKANLSCVPLSRHSLNLMDVPLISSFVQSSIDAALAEYVAPKSLTLDLKDMLMGDDFKKDTTARGVVVVYIKKARDFKEGDSSFGPLKDGSSDGYVTSSWAKFSKPLASTRIILSDMRPTWNEWAYLLVGPEELNAREALRLQLWDSDRTNADDDLGRVEVDLKDLMHDSKTKGQMYDREDRLMGEDPEEKMPGTLQWSVGYFPKTRITEEQLARQSAEPDIKSKEDLKKKVSQNAESKLREATAHDESTELTQQMATDYKEREDNLIISSPPPEDYPSGVLSIEVHNITGLELQKLRKNRKQNDEFDAEGEAENSDDLPSSYCTIILNHQKLYETRTKPKNAKPFFNAGTEKFVRNWKTAEVMISVRDSRVHEDDPLLGMIYLPLAELFKKRSQIMDSFPLAGGIGFGRARISLVFRSIELQAPKELLGWNYGTLEVNVPVKPLGSFPEEIRKLRIKLRTNVNRAKMQAGDGHWAPKHNEKSVYLAVRKRYSSPLVIEFRKSTLGPDKTAAFAVYWLSGIPDEEEKRITLQVWKGGKENLKHATSCCEYSGLEDGEKPIGEIELTMTYHRGLSGHFKQLSKKGKEKDLRDVMEVLDTANDEKEETDDDDGSEDSDSFASDTDDDEGGGKPRSRKDKLKRQFNADGASDEAEESDGIKQKLKAPVKAITDSHNDQSDGERGPINQLRDYKDHRKQLHRKQRGLMQFKAPRTVGWMIGKAKRGVEHATGGFKHGERDTGVETEV